MIDLARASRLAALIILGVSGIYFATKVMLFQGGTVDFKHLWLAGEIWENGANPYGDEYLEYGQAIFAGENIPTWMVYPPSWYLLARIVALFPYQEANAIWVSLSAIAVIMGGLIVVDTFKRTERVATLLEISGLFAFLMIGSASAIALSLGQTSPLVFLGFALFWRGWSLAHKPALIVGLILLMLKPNFGLPFAMLAATRPLFWGEILIAGAVSIAMAIPSFLADGLFDVLASYLALLSQYGSVDVNSAPNMTGIRNFIHLISGQSVGSFLLVGLAALVAMAIGIIGSVRQRLSANDEITLVLMTTFLFVPLHTYDLLVMAPILLFLHLEPLRERIVLGVSMLVLLRVNNVATVTGITSPGEVYFIGSTLASFMILTIFCVLVMRHNKLLLRLSS